MAGLLGDLGEGISNFMGNFGSPGQMPGMTDEERKYIQGQNIRSLGNMLLVMGMPMTAAQRAQALPQMLGNMPDPMKQLAGLQEMKMRQLQMQQVQDQLNYNRDFNKMFDAGASSSPTVPNPAAGAPVQPQTGDEIRAPLLPQQEKLVQPSQVPAQNPLGLDPEEYNYLRKLPATMRPKAYEELMQKKLTMRQASGLQEYDAYAQQERAAGKEPMSYFDYQIALKKAAQNQNNVTVALPGEPGADAKTREKLAEADSDVFKGYKLAADKSAGMMQDMDLLNALISDPGLPQGPLSGRLAQLFPGMNSKAAAFESVIQRIAPNMRQPGSGSQSDTELAGFLKSLPSLANRQDANQIITQVFSSKAAIDQARKEIVEKWQDGEIDLKTARKQINELNKRSILTPELRALLPNSTVAGGGSLQTNNDGSMVWTPGAQ